MRAYSQLSGPKASLSAVTVGAVLLMSSISHAQAPAADTTVAGYPACAGAPSAADTGAAKGAFQAGQAAFSEGDYARAILYWEDAYRRDCTAHKLLLNLARAYESDGQLPHAIRALETYNSRSPESADVAANQRRIERFRKQLENAAAPPPPAAPAAVKEPKPAETVTPEEPKDSAGKRPLLPLYVAGGGFVVGAIGGLLFLSAQSDITDAEKACGSGGPEACDNNAAVEAGQDANDSAWLWGAVSIIGFVGTAGGATWYFLSEPEPTTSARFTPVLGPKVAGFSVSGSF